MSFDSWVKNSWLERLQSDAPEIARLLALVTGASRTTRKRSQRSFLLTSSWAWRMTRFEHVGQRHCVLRDIA